MKTAVVRTLMLSALCLSACQQADPNAATEARNKAVMQQIFDAINTNNPDAFDALIDANFVEHSPDPNVQGTGLAALKTAIGMYHQATPDFKLTVNWMVAEGDLVVAHYTMKGTNTGPMGDMPATGKTMTVDGVDIARFNDGIGVEHWGYYDMQKMMEQLGMMPPGGAPPGETMME